ncbi:hypothetical protein AVEN_24657-1 [Araneus ventricosus]|uniref:Secreted protein n=1 Tax=Araneus ventricosus TaxID=182803 RepID=A0A4Y2T4Q1_ARAVE|nr:hypothetical protein AVEN_99411-1 [Araneus ventricosus]GBN95557.1 hypothetical protein AVEN_191424-1 [Araneus ventricosus]GBN95570.1 hypothetical protein AVEN_152029-1 [Araneus ventricosus]GBN95578.1 hypothetical protein AVEN_24657-1 [Araneus ventricosus]
MWLVCTSELTASLIVSCTIFVPESAPPTAWSFSSLKEPAGVFSPKLSRILPQKGAVSPSPAWLKKLEPTVTQIPMTIRRFFIIVIEKYLGKESNSKRCVPIFCS